MDPDDIAILAGFIVFLAIVIIALIMIWQTKLKKRRAMGKAEMRCPKCGAFVDPHTDSCPKCGAEFVQDSYECPYCGRMVHYGAKMCQCGRSLTEAKQSDYVCPGCGAPCEADSERCEKCGEKIWSPVKLAGKK